MEYVALIASTSSAYQELASVISPTLSNLKKTCSEKTNSDNLYIIAETMVKRTVLFKRCELFKPFIRYKLICTQRKVILNQKYKFLKKFYNLAFVEIN